MVTRSTLRRADTPAVTVRPGTRTDGSMLTALGAKTFYDTYAPDVPADDLATFIAANFRHDFVAAALVDPDQCYLVAAVDGADVGYALLRHEHGATPDGGTLELGSLYVDEPFQGCGVGAALMSESIARARRHRYRTLRLTVWEHNARAISFYRRWGFRTVGETAFLLGREEQRDLVMALGV
ncbi:MAG TPA: N-acetyltransferase [Euzebyales bacterium]|nr:N-acetyltransferase [Euzebyales bacterium]